MKPQAYTVTGAAAELGTTRQTIYHLLRQHDPQTGGTVLARHTPPGVAGETQILVTADSLRREMERRGMA